MKLSFLLVMKIKEINSSETEGNVKIEILIFSFRITTTTTVLPHFFPKEQITIKEMKF